ncbi:DegT/DnrJ/EryC1/StrS family aminotransferase [Chitinophaga nivalis]|uniref:DegT/DnrJ/EryC1/StrS family aminotransferase n=1 Tax=Chitinophaga nivalis TaxID=2991709 RepID=A0ABT3IEJ8_9BACT|nr:DegT/DnrJ/EryC1/StrS family aminotransferase [Chitinophaga nivalis]MCW3467927.1 DegT/DnrJ/EryC1/StrS family aminotransferase [Chitinophaga nivalis]MCW3482382.1 DegT/DnrJ/EryC1/StrS family aminotransferase [Chitinophaga nivalis]
MVPIQMVDLKRQYTKIKSQVDVAIQEVLENAAFINGGAVQQFAGELQQYLDVKHVIPCANGTDALQIAMMALGLEPGDEVITPSFTFIATAEVIALLRLKPVFVDIDPQTYCLDVAQVEKAITPKTKAIVPVHLYGHVTDMEALMEVANKHNLYVIEDNAQAIGGNYTFKDGSTKKAGTIGHIGCTSFFPSKNLGCYGDGGAIFTNDDQLAAQIRMVANHGQSARYYHDVVGCNSRLDTVQAAVLRIKLPLLDEYIKARRAVADAYDAAFADVPQITTPYRAPYSYHVFHQYTLQLNGADRNELQKYLAEKQVPSMIYYPVPAHRQKMFAEYGSDAFDLPVTDSLTSKVISLPIHTEMDTDQLDHIIQSVKSFLNNHPA